MRPRGQALHFAMHAGASPAHVVTAWRARRAAATPVGQAWDVVRVTRTLGLDALLRLQAQGIWLGPVLDVPPRAALEFLVPVGTARSWPALPGTVCVDRGTIGCPAPYLTAAGGHHARCGRRWINPPLAPAPAVTDPDALCEALATALVHEVRAGHEDLPTTAHAP